MLSFKHPRHQYGRPRPQYPPVLRLKLPRPCCDRYQFHRPRQCQANGVSLSPAGYSAQVPHLAGQSFWPAIIAWVLLKISSNPAVHFNKCRLPALMNFARIKGRGPVTFSSVSTTPQVFPRHLQVVAPGVESRCTLLANPLNQLNEPELRAVRWGPDDFPPFLFEHLLNSRVYEVSG